MYEFRRNQLIIMVLVFMIAIAGYLQLTTSPDDVSAFGVFDTPDEIDVNEVTNINYLEDLLALAPDFDESDLTIPTAEQLINIDGMEAVITKVDATVASSSSVMEASFFAEAKMDREQERAAKMEELSNYISNSAVDDDTKSKAAQTLLDLQDKIEKENNTESLLKARGFDDVYVRMDDNSVDVIINRSELSDEEIAQIEDIVSRTTGYKVSQIKIHMNGN
ncbi:MAG: hypothetical protein ATN33_06620 [Epulopiscium sp. Nele67-Bin001]|nr:MAG: hypothetical protein BEN18_06080 [Epulopiscium sp. Nuni2H_MBin001]OON92788.1 MAG: hypothetical protein ATN33_06620 [Epulopiscium sp. Nele67-Bin001]